MGIFFLFVKREEFEHLIERDGAALAEGFPVLGRDACIVYADERKIAIEKRAAA